MKTTKPNPRRNFLLVAGAGGAGVAAAVVAGTDTVPQGKAAVAKSEKSTTTAYSASPHVLKYYKTTEV